MAVSFVAASSGTNGNTTAAFIVAKPAGTQEDDLLLALFAATEDVDALAGWTFIRPPSSPPFGSRQIMCWYRVAGPAEPSTYELREVDGTPHSEAGGIIALRGADLVNPIGDDDGIVQTTPGTSLVIPEVDPSRSGGMLVAFQGAHANASATPPPGMSDLWDNKSAGLSQVQSSAATEVLAAAGPTGTRTFTLNVASTSAGLLLAIQPSSGRKWWLGVAGWG